ncbi:MAG: tetratricopeptide repeat protein [Deltaproteobacteria bacterium]
MANVRIDNLKALIAKNPNNTLGRYGLGAEYFKAGMYGECIEQIGLYLGVADDQGAAYRMLAEALIKLGRREEAKEAYRKGIHAASSHGHPSMAEEFEEALDLINAE